MLSFNNKFKLPEKAPSGIDLFIFDKFKFFISTNIELFFLSVMFLFNFILKFPKLESRSIFNLNFSEE